MANDAAILSIFVKAHGIAKTQAELAKLHASSERTARSTEKMEKRFSHLDNTVGDFNRTMQATRNAVGLVKFPALIAGAGAAAQVIGSLSAGVIALTSALAPASGALIAYGAGAAAAGQGMIAFKLGMGEVTKALGGNKQALKRLNPVQKDFVEHLKSIKKEWATLGIAVGKGMFPGFTQALKIVEPLIGRLRSTLRGTGQAFGDLAVMAAKTVRSWGGDINKVGRQNNFVIRALGKAAISLTTAFKDLLIAGGPLVHWMGEMLDKGAKWIATQVAMGRESGKLQKFFDHTRQTLTTLGHILRNVAVALFNTFNPGTALGEGLLRDLEKLTKKWADWTKTVAGQNAIKKFFDDSKAPLYAALGLIGDLSSALGRLFAPKEGTTGLINQLRGLTPLLEQMVSATTEHLAPALIEAARQFIRVFAALAGSSGPLEVTIALIGKLVGVLADLLESSPALNAMAVTVLGLGSSFKVLTIALLPLAGAMHIVEIATFGYASATASATKYTKLERVQLLGMLAVEKAKGAATIIMTNAQKAYNLVASGGIITLAKQKAAIVATTAVLIAQGIAEKATAAAAKALAAAQWLINVAMEANPVLLVVTALAALGAAFYLAYKKIGPFHDAVNAVWEAMKNVFAWVEAHWKLLVLLLGGPFGAAALAIIAHFDAIKSAALDAFNFIKDIAITVFKAMSVAVVAVVDAMKAAVDASFGAMKAVAIPVFNAIKTVVVGTFTAIKAVATPIVEAFKTIVVRDFQLIKSIAVPIFETMKTLIVGAFNGIKSGAKAAIDALLKAVKGVAGAFGAAAKAIGKAFADPIKSAFSAAVNTVRGFISTIIDVINKFLGFLKIPGIDNPFKSSPKPATGASAPRPPAGGQNAQRLAEGGKVTMPVAIMGEEAPRHPEWVIPTNPAYQKRAMGLWAKAGHDIGVPGFAFGGLLDKLDPAKAFDYVTSLPGKIAGSAGSLASSVIGKLPDNPMKGVFKGVGKFILHQAVNAIKSAAGSIFKASGEAAPRNVGNVSGLLPRVVRALAWARTHGWHGSVTSGFRSYAQQKALWDGAPGNGLIRGVSVAKPGTSSHESGAAVDVTDYQDFLKAMASAPMDSKLFWRGMSDKVHFSISGHRKGGLLKFAKGGRLGLGSLKSLWDSAGGDPSVATLMAHIAIAESGGWPMRNYGEPPPGTGFKGGDGGRTKAAGLWQILGLPFSGNAYTPSVNARMAVAKYKGAGGTSPWQSSMGAWGKWANVRDKGGSGGGSSASARPSHMVATKVAGGGHVPKIAKAKAKAGSPFHFGGSLGHPNTGHLTQTPTGGGPPTFGSTIAGMAGATSPTKWGGAGEGGTIDDYYNAMITLAKGTSGLSDDQQALANYLSYANKGLADAVKNQDYAGIQNFSQLVQTITDAMGNLSMSGIQDAFDNIDTLVSIGKESGGQGTLDKISVIQGALSSGQYNGATLTPADVNSLTGTLHDLGLGALSDSLGHIDKLVRAGDESQFQGVQDKIDILQRAVDTGMYDGVQLTPDDILDLRGDIKELRASMDTNAATIADLTAQLKLQNEFASSVAGITSREAVKFMADMISGQIMGPGYSSRALTASAGQTVRY